MFLEKPCGSSYAQAKREASRLDSSLIQTGSPLVSLARNSACPPAFSTVYAGGDGELIVTADLAGGGLPVDVPCQRMKPVALRPAKPLNFLRSAA
jgi:hypothetical protein